MPIPLKLLGQKFGRLTVLSRGPNDKHHKAQWFCKCDCGTKVLVVSRNLTTGNSESCGCLHKEKVGNQFRKHGASHTTLYGIFSEAKQRCTNPRSKNWKDYGARGIEFRFTSFRQFADELGPKPSPKHTLDRKENSGHYEPGNIHWATMKEQCANRRRRRKNV